MPAGTEEERSRTLEIEEPSTPATPAPDVAERLKLAGNKAAAAANKLRPKTHTRLKEEDEEQRVAPPPRRTLVVVICTLCCGISLLITGGTLFFTLLADEFEAPGGARGVWAGGGRELAGCEAGVHGSGLNMIRS